MKKKYSSRAFCLLSLSPTMDWNLTHPRGLQKCFTHCIQTERILYSWCFNSTFLHIFGWCLDYVWIFASLLCCSCFPIHNRDVLAESRCSKKNSQVWQKQWSWCQISKQLASLDICEHTVFHFNTSMELLIVTLALSTVFPAVPVSTCLHRRTQERHKLVAFLSVPQTLVQVNPRNKRSAPAFREKVNPYHYIVYFVSITGSSPTRGLFISCEREQRQCYWDSWIRTSDSRGKCQELKTWKARYGWGWNWDYDVYNIW